MLLSMYSIAPRKHTHVARNWPVKHGCSSVAFGQPRHLSVQQVLEWVARLNRKEPLPGRLVHRRPRSGATGAASGPGKAETASVQTGGADNGEALAAGVTMEEARPPGCVPPCVLALPTAGFHELGFAAAHPLKCGLTAKLCASMQGKRAVAAPQVHQCCRTQQAALPAQEQPQQQRRGCLSLVRRGAAAIGASTRHMFATWKLGLTSGLLVGIWFSVALAYYGMIIFNTTLQVKDERCDGERALIPDDSYRDVFVTTLGEVRGAAVLLTTRSVWAVHVSAAALAICTAAFPA